MVWNLELQISSEPAATAHAGGPYSVPEGGTVQLIGSATADPGQSTSSLTYLWDLNANGVFGETGVAATRGDEIGMNPTFSATGLDGPSSWKVSLEVIDRFSLISTDTAAIQITNVVPTVACTGPTNGVPGQAAR